MHSGWGKGAWKMWEEQPCRPQVRRRSRDSPEPALELISTHSPWRSPRWSRHLCPEGSCNTWRGAHRGAGPWQDTQPMEGLGGKGFSTSSWSRITGQSLCARCLLLGRGNKRLHLSQTWYVGTGGERGHAGTWEIRKCARACDCGGCSVCAFPSKLHPTAAKEEDLLPLFIFRVWVLYLGAGVSCSESVSLGRVLSSAAGSIRKREGSSHDHQPTTGTAPR